MAITQTRTMNNGVSIPVNGFGVFQADDKQTEEAVLWALEAGYRHIDTAKIYNNEKAVGRAVASCGIPREDIFITTKLWNQDMRDNRQADAFEESLDRLGMDYVDLYLIHWPVHNFVDSWRIMEKIYADGKARAIGVSNFQPHHLNTLAEQTNIVPAVNQVECHPYLAQHELQAFCEERNIMVEAWSPFGGAGAGILKDPAIQAIAEAYGKDVGQIVLRWLIQRGIIALSKSVTQERIASNVDVFSFSLDASAMRAMESLNQNRRLGADPDNFSF